MNEGKDQIAKRRKGRERDRVPPAETVLTMV